MVPAKWGKEGLLLDCYTKDLEKNDNVSPTQANPLSVKYIKFNAHCRDNRTEIAKHITSRVLKECNLVLCLFPACNFTYFSFNV